MRIIFLDIDGVMNSVDTTLAFSGGGLNRKKRLDPVSIGLLKKLCDETNAKIVISSTWRLGRTIQDFIDIFSTYNWKDAPVIGKTVVLNYKGRTRGDEIQCWIEENNVQEYVILDDDSDMLQSQKHRFVHVSNVNGFRSKHYCQCLRLFGMPDDRLEHQVNWVRKDALIEASNRVVDALQNMTDEELIESLERCGGGDASN